MRSSTTTTTFLALALYSLVTAASDLTIEVTKAASCTRKTEKGDTISVNYKGTLQSDGSQFDSSYERGQPINFQLGTGQVIQGWDDGLLGMCIGEGRKLTIPPSMAYGQSQNGPIPAGSTLIFETELVGIKGVEKEVQKPPPPPPKPTAGKPDKQAEDDKDEEAPPTIPTGSASPTGQGKPSSSTAEPVTAASSDDSPMNESEDGECHLLGPYALIVQGALGILALMSLVVKRWREHPRRPLKIWFFDVSKQVFGSVLLHLANVLMSMLSSGSFDVAAKTKGTQQYAGTDDEGKQPNPCSFYLLNIAVDTTIGIPILVLLLKVLHRAFLLTPMARPQESIRSGNYGHPPRATWWLKQSFIYFLGLLGMKLCVFFIFQLLPWIAWVGDWALRWTEGNEAIQITFVMFIFPLVMNALQYWIIDGFIKENDATREGEEGYVGVQGEESDDEDDEWLERQRQSADVERDGETDRLKEANPTPIPVRTDDEAEGSGDGKR